MPRPKDKVTGKVTDFRTELDYLRSHPEVKSAEDPEVSGFDALLTKVKTIYKRTGSIAKTASALKVGKRTLERAIRDVAELSRAIESARVTMGR